LTRHNFVINTAEFDASIRIASSFEIFQWQHSEDVDTPEAVQHLRTELTNFGIQFGPNHYKLCDIHNIREMLSVHDDKLGNLSGGADAMIVPYSLASISYHNHACVVFEFKTTSDSVKKFSAQGFLQLIAACYHSSQMPMVVITDLNTTAQIFTLGTNVSNSSSAAPPNSKIIVNQYENLTLDQMAAMVANHLQHCTPDTTHSYDQPDSASATNLHDRTLRQFKKAKVSHGTSVVMEQFEELIADTEFGSAEYNQIIQHYANSGVFNLDWQSMYA
jgi:hypothetical protein